MTEIEKRQSVANIMIGWKGRKESDGSHKLIIDIYNNHKPLAQGYAVSYKDNWCMTAASAAYIKAGLADIFPLECSCSRAIEKAKKMGIWVENDAYVPKVADAVLYDWDDNGIGDNTGNPEHVGLVTAVKGNKIEVMEGNKHDAVAERTIEINQRYIRGYIAPKFSGDSTSAPVTPSQPAKTETKPATSTATTSTVLKKGSKGSAVGTMQTMLKELGYYTGNVDNDFGSKSEAAVKAFQKVAFPDNSSEWDGKYGPKTKEKLETAYKNRSLSSYATIHTSGKTLRLRNSSGTQIGSIPNGTKVKILQKAAKTMTISGTKYSMTKISYNGAVGYVANTYLKY